MPQTLGPILKTLLFTLLVPGVVTGYVPYLLLGRIYRPGHGLLSWLGVLILLLGACIYFACAWEFAVRGLGTPAPIAPTKALVVSGLHRYVRNPMYIGVLLVILGATRVISIVLPCSLRSRLYFAGAFLRSFLRRAHVASAVWRLLRPVQGKCSAVDPAARPLGHLIGRALR